MVNRNIVGSIFWCDNKNLLVCPIHRTASPSLSGSTYAMISFCTYNHASHLFGQKDLDRRSRTSLALCMFHQAGLESDQSPQYASDMIMRARDH